MASDENAVQSISKIISWLFCIVFIVIGVANSLWVHPVPALFYLLLSSTVYFPPTNALFKKRFGVSTPLVIKIVLGLAVLWGTLAVGDLVEMIEGM